MAAPANADGPGAHKPAPPAAIAPVISAQDAIDAYNLGYAAIQRADHADALAQSASSAAEKKQNSRAAQDAYKQSLQHFSAAVRLDASMHEAYTYLGYANRKLGRHSQALEAYDQALRIDSDYPYAIEYQGEAFLGLDRIEEARFNYLRLYALNKGQARKLLQAMQSWVDSHASDATGFAAWVAERAETTRNDSPSSGW